MAQNVVTGFFQVRAQGHNYNIVAMKRISLETYMLILWRKLHTTLRPTVRREGNRSEMTQRQEHLRNAACLILRKPYFLYILTINICYHKDIKTVAYYTLLHNYAALKFWSNGIIFKVGFGQENPGN